MKCRHCTKKLVHTFIDLGTPPPSNSYLTKQTIGKPEKCYPLKVLICDRCWLVQTKGFVEAEEMFSANYAYFSSFSSSWLEHAKNYVEQMTLHFNLTVDSTVVEIAANDGYLLQYVQAKGIPCYGIEPTHSTAAAAGEKGLEIFERFFDSEMAKELVNKQRQADLIVANNVLAHVPDINDFVNGFSLLLNPGGVATFEFPHLLNLVENIQFDTIYHEHYSYLSLTAVTTIFKANGLTIFDVDELPTHGGSLRVYSQRADSCPHTVSKAVTMLLDRENLAGINTLNFYRSFAGKAEHIKNDVHSFLQEAKQRNKKVGAYGAAAKGNTLLNYAGINTDLVPFVVDRNPSKQGKYMPGSRIPIVSESYLKQYQPDYLLILPWNIKAELFDQLEYIKDWGGQFVTSIPSLEIV